MRDMKHILYLSILFVLTNMLWSCGDGVSMSESRQRLLQGYNSAEYTIRNEGNYPKALGLYLAFIRGAENDSTMEDLLMTAYVSVAVIYGSFDDVENAIVYNRRAYSLAKKLGDTRISELALTNLAQSYMMKRGYDSASRMADSLLTLNQSESRTLMFHYSIIKGEVALRLDRYDEALAHIRKADSVVGSGDFSRYECSAPPGLMARYYEKINMPDSQLVYLDRVWELVEADNDPQPKAECARWLMNYHTKYGNLAEARKYQVEYLKLTDSLVNLQQFLSVGANHQQSQIALKGEEINILNREASYHKVIIAVVASLLSLAIVFIVVIVYQKKRLDAAYRALFEKDRRLMSMLDEQQACEPACDSANGISHTTDAGGCDTMEEGRNRDLYDRIVKLMETTRDYLNPDFGLGNLVSMAGSNVAYVSKAVKQYSGLNVPSFINEYRIREACRRILDEANFGNITFAAIGESVGFSSQVSFNRAFKKVTGLTPSLYQKMVSDKRRKN